LAIDKYVRYGAMTPFQVMAVSICLVINFLDGFDVLAIAFAAPSIAADWDVAPSALGVIFSAGLAGMVVGALFLSPWADRVGRRPLILTCLVIIGAGMLGSAAAGNVAHLIGWRLLTGLGVGGMLASLTTMVAEYSSDKRRQFAISVLQSGYPVGAIIAGVVSVALLDAYGWRSIFLVGGVLSLAIIPLVYWGLPESVHFLLHRRPAGALDKINAILRRMQRGEIDALPPAKPAMHTDKATFAIFAPQYLGRTLAIWFAYLVTLSAWYFVTNWTPKILVDAGLARDAAISGGVLIAVGGVCGGLVLGWLSQRIAVNRIGAAYMLLGIAAMTLFGLLDAELSRMLFVAFLIGFFVAGAIIGLYAIVPDLYPAGIRNTGIGWALGIGRLGAVIGPYIAGLLIEGGWERAQYYFAMSLPLLASLIAVVYLQRVGSRS
jgi:benzoate transport